MEKIYEPKFFEIPTQVKFLDLGDTGTDEDVWIGGIAYGDDIICGCCGAIISIEELFEDWNEFKDEHPNIDAPLETLSWVSISDEIIDN